MMTTQDLGFGSSFLPITERKVEIQDMPLRAPIFPSVCMLVLQELCRELAALKPTKDDPECIFSLLF